MIRAESAKSQIRATVSRALATALVTGISNCSEENRPLSELQMIDLATMHVMAYDAALEACGAIDVEVKLQERKDDSDAFRYRHDLERLARMLVLEPEGPVKDILKDILRKYV